eukprot:6779896-Alexandrium_andersonii.AAC.1
MTVDMLQGTLHQQCSCLPSRTVFSSLDICTQACPPATELAHEWEVVVADEVAEAEPLRVPAG